MDMKRLPFCLSVSVFLFCGFYCCEKREPTSTETAAEADSGKILSQYGFERDTMSAPALYEKGYALFEKKNFRDAAVLFQAALDLDSSPAPLHYYYAVNHYLLYGNEPTHIDIVFRHLESAVAIDPLWLHRLKTASGLETLKESNYFRFVNLYKKLENFREPPDTSQYNPETDKMTEYYFPEKSAGEEEIRFINDLHHINELEDKKSFLLGTWYVDQPGSSSFEIITYYKDGTYAVYTEKHCGGEMDLRQCLPYDKFEGRWDFDAGNLEIYYQFDNGGGTEKIIAGDSASVTVEAAEKRIKRVRKFAPLHYAAIFGDLEKIKLLEKARVDMNLENYKRQTPLSLARDHGRQAVIEYLSKKD